MAYDEDLANRVRELVGREAGIAERCMFGGLAMMVNGNMAVVVRGAGGLVVRVHPSEFERLRSEPGARATAMRGRPMRGWITRHSSACERDADLARWVEHGVRYAGALPAKCDDEARPGHRGRTSRPGRATETGRGPEPRAVRCGART